MKPQRNSKGQFIKGNEGFWLGKKRSPETIEKIAKMKRGKQTWMKGKHHTKEANMKNSIAHLGKYDGEKHWNWQGGITPINLKIRRSHNYRLWRIAVFTRDNWTCQECSKHGGNMEADHIKPFSKYPELRFAIDNGRTLCVDCHRQTATYGWKLLRKEAN